jgi:hypothetical protein
MNYGQIQDEVSIILQDESLIASIPGYINQAYREALFRARHPSLKSITSVQTVLQQNWLTLGVVTGGFDGKLLRFGDPTKIKQYPSLEALYDDYSSNWDDEGPVQSVALEGNIIWYQKIPDPEETHIVMYIKNPDPLTRRSDTPDLIPEALHRDILVHGAVMHGFILIEDGMEGEKINSMVHAGFFEKGVQRMMEWIGSNKQHKVINFWSV